MLTTGEPTPVRARSLDPLLDPASVAVVGASPTLDRAPMRILDNLRRFGFAGRVYGVHPRHTEVFGYPCLPSLSALPEVPDVVVLAVSGPRIVETLQEAAALGVPAAIVYASALNEPGVDPAARAEEIRRALAPTGMRLLGPNTQGSFKVASGACLSWSAAFSGEQPLEGGCVAWVSQSGAVGTAVASMMRSVGLGLTHWISLGNELDIEFSEAVRHVLADPATTVVCGYVESIRDVPAFRSVAAQAQRMGKRIVLVKGGVSPVGSAAAATHTGALASRGALFEGLFRQCGVIQAKDLDEMVAVAWLASRRPDIGTAGRVAILSNSGGLGIILADRCHEAGLQVPSFGAEVQDAVRPLLPDFVEAANPLDMPIVSMRRPDDVPEILARLHAHERFDAYLLVLLGVREAAGYDVDRLLEAVLRADELTEGRLLPVFLSGEEGLDARVRAHGIQSPADVGRAVPALGRLTATTGRSRGPVRGPAVGGDDEGHPVHGTRLTEAEGKEWLRGVGVPVPPGALVTSPAEAVAAAERIGYPVVLKVVSRDITHKTDVGGVVVGLRGADEVRAGFQTIMERVRVAAPGADIGGCLVEAMAEPGAEVVVAVHHDDGLGPVIMVGSGGTMVEVLEDVAFRCLPLSTEDAEQMIDETLASRLLSGVRGRGPQDRGALIELMTRLSDLVTADANRVDELELNPVLVHDQGAGVTVVDAVLTVRPERG